jgi:hypothetical protein
MVKEEKSKGKLIDSSRKKGEIIESSLSNLSWSNTRLGYGKLQTGLEKSIAFEIWN